MLNAYILRKLVYLSWDLTTILDWNWRRKNRLIKREETPLFEYMQRSKRLRQHLEKDKGYSITDIFDIAYRCYQFIKEN